MLKNSELAEIVARSVRTLGGYIYEGTRVIGTVPGLAQEMWSCVGEDFRPGEEDVARNEELLAAAPLGAVVGLESRGQNTAVSETWKKGRNGKWTKTEDWEERWGDWGGTGEDRLTGGFWQYEN